MSNTPSMPRISKDAQRQAVFVLKAAFLPYSGVRVYNLYKSIWNMVVDTGKFDVTEQNHEEISEVITGSLEGLLLLLNRTKNVGERQQILRKHLGEHCPF